MKAFSLALKNSSADTYINSKATYILDTFFDI